jgi:ATP-binding cassette subfamily B protein
MLLAGVLPVLLIGGAVMLWQQGQATAGDIAASGAIALRIAQMSGWVSFTLMSIYTSVGEVEDGMRTLTAPHTLTDAPDAKALVRVKGEIRFDGVTFAYGRERGGVSGISLTVKAGEKLGIVGASGAGKSSLVDKLALFYRQRGERVGIVAVDPSSPFSGTLWKKA